MLYSRGPKKLLTTTELVTKRPKGKKCHVKEEHNQAAEINLLPTQSRRETRNSVKAAAAFQKQKENSDEIIKNNKRQLMYVSPKVITQIFCIQLKSMFLMCNFFYL